jgi:hypothetical protein
MERIDKIFFQGRVVDNDDRLRLGRLRVIPEGENVDEIKNSIIQACKDPNDTLTGIKTTCKWTKDDPFTIIPLLPYSLNVTPKVRELVHIMYFVVQNGKSQSRKYADRAKFYIPSLPSTPLSSAYEDGNASKVHLTSGDNLKPAKNLKEVNGKIPIETFGVFPEPEDNAILGRGTADIILKDDTALVRAGKSKDMIGPTTNLPTENEKRAFLQLTDFVTNQKRESERKSSSFNLEYTQLIYLIEWHISNPENEMGVFSGYINLYSFFSKNDERINTKNFKVDTDVDNLKGTQIFVSIDFLGKQYQEVVNIFNSFIDGLSNGEIFVKGYSQRPFIPEKGKQFPFAFRPSPATYRKLVGQSDNSQDSSPFVVNNIGSFFKDIGLSTGSPQRGFGIVTSKNSTKIPESTKNQKYRPISSGTEGISYGMLGAQRVYIYSHDSQIGVKKPSLKNTIYGISQPKFLELEDSTEPMVRGEKLMDLMNLIVRFLTSHVHPYHGLPPVPTAQDGTLSADILQKMQDAPNTILNENIRIN